MKRLSPKPDAFLASCPSRAVFARISEKWAMLVIVALEQGALRNGELRRHLDGVSQKMLTQTLRHLERDGIVRRVVRATRPVHVEYTLTARGATLVPLVVALKLWSERSFAWIERNQVSFDRK